MLSGPEDKCCLKHNFLINIDVFHKFYIFSPEQPVKKKKKR